MMVHACVHRTLGFGESEQGVQNQFSTLFMRNTVHVILG